MFLSFSSVSVIIPNYTTSITSDCRRGIVQMKERIVRFIASLATTSFKRYVGHGRSHQTRSSLLNIGKGHDCGQRGPTGILSVPIKKVYNDY